MSSSKVAPSWVPGNAPGNTLKRNDSIKTVRMKKLDREWVERFSGLYPKFTAIVQSLYMLKEGHCDTIYTKQVNGCARTWENVKLSQQVDVLSTFDIVGMKLRNSDEMYSLALLQWEEIHVKPCPPEKKQAAISFRHTDKFERLNVRRDMLLYRQVLHTRAVAVQKASTNKGKMSLDPVETGASSVSNPDVKKKGAKRRKSPGVAVPAGKSAKRNRGKKHVKGGKP